GFGTPGVPLVWVCADVLAGVLWAARAAGVPPLWPIPATIATVSAATASAASAGKRRREGFAPESTPRVSDDIAAGRALGSNTVAPADAPRRAGTSASS